MKARPLSYYIWLHYYIMLIPALALIGFAVYLRMWWLVAASIAFLALVAAVKLKLMRDLQRDVARVVAQADASLAGQHVEPLRTVFAEINKISETFAAAEKERQLITDELRHRGRNTLGKVQALMVVAIRKSPSTEVAAKRVFELIAALQRQDDLLMRHGMRGASLREVLAQELELYRGQDGIELLGADVALGRVLAEDLGLVAHELATNAAKHGSLGSPDGKLAVSWTCANGECALSWVESGGPPPKREKPAGLGTLLVDSVLAKHSGRVEREFSPDGLRLMLTFKHEASK